MLAQLFAERLVALDLCAVCGEQLLRLLRRRTTTGLLFREDAPQQPLHQRAPRDDADAVVLRRGDDLLLDMALDEVVQALLAHEPQEVAAASGLLRLRDRPARKVRRADIEHFALLDKHF